MTAQGARPYRAIVFALAAVALLGAATVSSACPVCFGDSDAQIVKGLEASVLFLVAVTYFLILGGVATFVVLRRRARRAQTHPAETA